jgi:hypothetical protein
VLTIGLGGRRVGVACSDVELRDVLDVAGPWVVDDDPDVLRNLLVRFSRSPRELHLLQWGGCIIARERTRQGVLEALDHFLGSLAAVPPALARLWGAFIVLDGTIVGVPEFARPVAWRAAAQLGATVVLSPALDAGPDGSAAVPGLHDAEARPGVLSLLCLGAPDASREDPLGRLALAGFLRRPIGDLGAVTSLARTVEVVAVDEWTVPHLAAAVVRAAETPRPRAS